MKLHKIAEHKTRDNRWYIEYKTEFGETVYLPNDWKDCGFDFDIAIQQLAKQLDEKDIVLTII